MAMANGYTFLSDVEGEILYVCDILHIVFEKDIRASSHKISVHTDNLAVYSVFDYRRHPDGHASYLLITFDTFGCSTQKWFFEPSISAPGSLRR